MNAKKPAQVAATPTPPKLVKAKLTGYVPSPDYPINNGLGSLDFVTNDKFDLEHLDYEHVRITSRTDPKRSVVAATAWQVFE